MVVSIAAGSVESNFHIMLDRRSFLQSFATAVGVAAIDPEKLLWKPGEKIIFIPPSPKLINVDLELFRVGDVITIEGIYAYNPITHTPTTHLKQFVVTADDILEFIPSTKIHLRYGR